MLKTKKVIKVIFVFISLFYFILGIKELHYCVETYILKKNSIKLKIDVKVPSDQFLLDLKKYNKCIVASNIVVDKGLFIEATCPRVMTFDEFRENLGFKTLLLKIVVQSKSKSESK